MKREEATPRQEEAIPTLEEYKAALAALEKTKDGECCTSLPLTCLQPCRMNWRTGFAQPRGRSLANSAALQSKFPGAGR